MLCMSAQPSWDDLAIFLAVARGGGASAAARMLHIHHATASRRIADLEAQLGTRLFNRSAQGMTLTTSGEDLLTHVLAIEEEVSAIGRKIAGRDDKLKGLVSVSTVDDLALFIMPSLLRAFRERHPDVTVELDIQTARADLSRREADLAIRFGRPPDDPGSVRRKLIDVPGLLYASTDYLDRHGRPDCLESLERHPIVRGGDRLSALPHEVFWTDRAHPNQVAMCSNSFLAQYAAIRAGLGIGMLSQFVVTPGDGLEALDLPVPDFTVPLWLVIHGDMRDVPRVRAFAAFVVKHFRQERERFGVAYAAVNERRR